MATVKRRRVTVHLATSIKLRDNVGELDSLSLVIQKFSQLRLRLEVDVVAEERPIHAVSTTLLSAL